MSYFMAILAAFLASHQHSLSGNDFQQSDLIAKICLLFEEFCGNFMIIRFYFGGFL